MANGIKVIDNAGSGGGGGLPVPTNRYQYKHTSANSQTPYNSPGNPKWFFITAGGNGGCDGFIRLGSVGGSATEVIEVTHSNYFNGYVYTDILNVATSVGTMFYEIAEF